MSRVGKKLLELVIFNEFYVTDETFSFQDFSDFSFQLRSRNFELLMTYHVCITNSSQHICNRICHNHYFPASKLKREIAEILKREGFIRDVEFIEDNKQGIIRVFLKYGQNNERVITGLKRISKPGLRVYAKSNEVVM